MIQASLPPDSLRIFRVEFLHTSDPTATPKCVTSTMALEKFKGLELPAAADMHVHLREGAMMELVTYINHSEQTSSVLR